MARIREHDDDFNSYPESRGFIAPDPQKEEHTKSGDGPYRTAAKIEVPKPIQPEMVYTQFPSKLEHTIHLGTAGSGLPERSLGLPVYVKEGSVVASRAGFPRERLMLLFNDLALRDEEETGLAPHKVIVGKVEAKYLKPKYVEARSHAEKNYFDWSPFWDISTPRLALYQSCRKRMCSNYQEKLIEAGYEKGIILHRQALATFFAPLEKLLSEETSKAVEAMREARRFWDNQ